MTDVSDSMFSDEPCAASIVAISPDGPVWHAASGRPAARTAETTLLRQTLMRRLALSCMQTSSLACRWRRLVSICPSTPGKTKRWRRLHHLHLDSVRKGRKLD